MLRMNNEHPNIKYEKDTAGMLWLSARVTNPNFWGSGYIEKMCFSVGTPLSAANETFLWTVNYKRLVLV
jgi:hypothetical protein